MKQGGRKEGGVEEVMGAAPSRVSNDTAQLSTAQLSLAQHSTAQRNAAQHTAQHGTAQSSSFTAYV